ncbi:FadR family transcriptional regulator [Methylobacterium sp. BTF04]|uniref:FadR/GntR family transcriptional regulator n=1 Tax=Methylobacterium sp. BTF04 TaxID=2708300 RepID=UPI0013D75E12|nr:FadR/GntR family transcriptional regulator [Methylobacterium sp. BTF04]NEU12882.1 FadR family transcriptional regulator [Methylobacterium sp. BTF04]
MPIIRPDANTDRPPERRLYQLVADRLRALIQEGNFRIGDRLPSERELALQLGVSRPSLREALIALEIEGAVEVRMGSGIYVLSITEQRSLPIGSIGESPVELMQARAVVEGAVILMAAPRMTPEVFASLRKSLDDMRISIAEGTKPLDDDRRFHLTIAKHAGNGVLSRMVRDLFDERHSPLSAKFRHRFETVAGWKLALSEHETILSALEAGDPLLAQAMMHVHIAQSGLRWLGSDDR